MRLTRDPANPIWSLRSLSRALIVFASVATDTFLTERNLTSMSRQIVTNGFLSLGMLLVILTGGIDLSVGAVVAFAGLLAAGLQATMPWPVAILVALAMGLLVGAVNGVLVARFKPATFHRNLGDNGQPAGTALHLFAKRRNIRRIRCSAACWAADSSGRCRFRP